MSVVLSAIIGVILTIGGVVAAKPLMRLLNTPENIIESSALYLTTMISGTLVVMAYKIKNLILLELIL